MEQYKLTKSQMQMLYGALFTVERKKALRENLIEFGIYIKENFDRIAMEKAVNCLIERNDALRLQILLRPYGFRQQINPYVPHNFIYREISNSDCFQKLVSEHLCTISILNKCLMQAVIVSCDDAKKSGGVILIFHHICCDGYSVSLIHEKVESYYERFKKGEEPAPEKEYSIAKVLEQEEVYLSSEKHKTDKRFWKYQYNHQPNYSFPVGRIPWKCSLSEEELVLDGEIYEAFLSLTKKYGVSTTSALMTLGAITVKALSGGSNFALYTITHGRITLPQRKTIGCLMNAYPVFYNIDESVSVGEYLLSSYSDYLMALSHGRVSLTEQVLMAAKETYIKRFGYNHMWFMVSTMDYYDVGDKIKSELVDAPMEYTVGMFYCAILNESANHLMRIQLTYQDLRFCAEQVRHMLSTFLLVLRMACRKDDLSIQEICEKAAQNNTDCEYE